MKPIWKSRVFWVNFAAGVAALLETTQITNVIPNEWLAPIGAALALLNIVLRFSTTESVSMTGK